MELIVAMTEAAGLNEWFGVVVVVVHDVQWDDSRQVGQPLGNWRFCHNIAVVVHQVEADIDACPTSNHADDAAVVDVMDPAVQMHQAFETVSSTLFASAWNEREEAT